MTKVKNLIVASPLIQEMPKSFVEALSQDYGISFSGRYSKIFDEGKPLLKDMIINTPKAFEAPSDFVGLSLNSTEESFDPLILSVGVETKNCTNAFEISDKNKIRRYNLGVVCKRGDSGRLAILGSEFADFKTTEQDLSLIHI